MYLAAADFDAAFYDRETQPHAAVLAVAGSFQTIERRENPVEFFGGQAWPGIGNQQDNVPGFLANDDQHRTGIARVANRIADQVAHGTEQIFTIGHRHHGPVCFDANFGTSGAFAPGRLAGNLGYMICHVLALSGVRSAHWVG